MHSSSRVPAKNVHLDSNHREVIRPPETVAQFIGLDPPEEEMATCSSIVAWKSHGHRAWRETVHGIARMDMTEHSHMHLKISLTQKRKKDRKSC